MLPQDQVRSEALPSLHHRGAVPELGRGRRFWRFGARGIGSHDQGQSPPAASRPRTNQGIRSLLLPYGMLILAGFIVLAGAMGLWWYSVTREIGQLTETREKLRLEEDVCSSSRRRSPSSKRSNSCSKAASRHREAEEAQTGPVQLLSHVILSIPRDTNLWLTQLDQRGDRVQIVASRSTENRFRLHDDLAAVAFSRALNSELIQVEKEREEKPRGLPWSAQAHARPRQSERTMALKDLSFENLPRSAQISIFAVLAVALVFVFHSYYMKGLLQERDVLRTEVARLEVEVAQGKAIETQHERFKVELAQLEERLKTLRDVLPSARRRLRSCVPSSRWPWPAAQDSQVRAPAVVPELSTQTGPFRSRSRFLQRPR